METKEIIASMLVENTGRHFLDSGGAYGRAWERNQAAVAEKEITAVEYFEARPEAYWSYGPTLDVYHFLVNSVEYNERLDRAWRKWVFGDPGTGNYRYSNGCGTADEFIELLQKKGWADDSTDFAHTWINTYNGEDCVSQTLQYVLFDLTDSCPWGEGNHVLLSIHGGADVRGGYTDLRAFEASPWDSPSLFDNARCGLHCGNVEGHRNVHKDQMKFDGSTEPDLYLHWYSDDAGYSWYNDEFDLDPVPNGEHGEDVPLCPLCNEELQVSPY